MASVAKILLSPITLLKAIYWYDIFALPKVEKLWSYL